MDPKQQYTATQLQLEQQTAMQAVDTTTGEILTTTIEAIDRRIIQPGIQAAIVNIISEIGSVAKSKRNADQGFMFRSIDDVMKAVQPLLAKNGVFVKPNLVEKEIIQRETKKGGFVQHAIVTVDYTLTSLDGSEIVCRIPGEAMDSGDKAFGKAMSYALKTLYINIFCIPVEDPNIEPDYTVHNTETKGTPKQSPTPPQQPAGNVPAKAPVTTQAQAPTRQRYTREEVRKNLAALINAIPATGNENIKYPNYSIGEYWRKQLDGAFQAANITTPTPLLRYLFGVESVAELTNVHGYALKKWLTNSTHHSHAEAAEIIEYCKTIEQGNPNA